MLLLLLIVPIIGVFMISIGISYELKGFKGYIQLDTLLLAVFLGLDILLYIF